MANLIDEVKLAAHVERESAKAVKAAKQSVLRLIKTRQEFLKRDTLLSPLARRSVLVELKSLAAEIKGNGAVK